VDLVLRNAIVDAAAPTAVDVGVADGRIVQLGHGLAEAAREIDVEGRLVVPGFVETHIHLDKACILHRCKPERGTLDEAIVDVHTLHRFLVGEEGDLPHAHRVHLHDRIERGIDCAVDRVFDRLPGHRRPVAPHQHNLLVGKDLGERGAKLRRRHQHVRGFFGEFADLESRDAAAQKTAHVIKRSQRHLTHTKRDKRGRVAVNHRLDIGARLVDFTVNEALIVRTAVS